MSAAARKSALNARLAKVQAAIDGTLDRNALSYSINGRSLASLSLSELRDLEKDTLNELARLTRGRRFGGIGFEAVSS